jgi:hypothetical protein
VKEISDDFEIIDRLYTSDQVSKNKFDIRQSKLFDDNFFQLPPSTDNSLPNPYICSSYCPAFIHSLNLAAQNLVYATTA